MTFGVASALWLCSVFSAAGGDSLVSIGDQKYLSGNLQGGKITFLKYPTLGCPSIVQVGGMGQAWIKLANGGTTTGFNLTLVPTADPVPTPYSLPVKGIAFDAATSLYKVTFGIPANVPEDTYDLQLSIPALAATDIQYNCVRVVLKESSAYNFLVISDTHFNTPTGWWEPANYNTGNYNAFSIIQQMKKEIRALNPTFVILSGDLMFGLDYNFEYENVWNLWKDLGVPIFMVPGNHDGISGLEERSYLGAVSPKRDGLEYWHKYFGPHYYSFQFGGIHFQGVNSMDGTPERRDGFLIVIRNYGGDLLAPQMDWISSDLAAATGTIVPFLHHNPMGPYKPNETFSMSSWIQYRIWLFLTTGELSLTDHQVWNTESTGKFLLSKWANLPLVFCGHNHADELKLSGTTTFRHVTCSGAESADYWGYSLVRVKNSKIADHLYLDANKYQSIPTGNLHVTYTDATGPIQKAQVTSGLSRSYDLTLEFAMPSAPEYVVGNGTIVQKAAVDGKTTKLWVRATTPIASKIESPKSFEVSVAIPGVLESVETAPADGGSCGAPKTPHHASGFLFLVLLPLGALLLRRSSIR